MIYACAFAVLTRTPWRVSILHPRWVVVHMHTEGLVAWGLCECMLIRTSAVWLLPFTVF